MKKIFLYAILATVSYPALAQKVSLAWTEPTTTIPLGFNVYRIAATICPTFSTATWTKVQGSINSASPQWDDTTIALNSNYCYAVTAYSTLGDGESGPSNIISVSTTAPVSKVPPTPGNLKGTLN